MERLAQANGTSKADVLRFAVEFLRLQRPLRRRTVSVSGAWTDEDGIRSEREFIGL